MRTILLLTNLFLCISIFGQDGLEGIIVEKYYVTSKKDQKGELHSGEIPEGSVTYRIYVDLKPGYRFQIAYGSPEHPLRFLSTAPFYNHPEVGTTHPNILPERALKKNISLLDSWLSVGAAGENHLGVLKAEDVGQPDSIIKFESGYFETKMKRDFTPIQRDGMVRTLVQPFPTFFQMDSALTHLGSATNSNLIEVTNGAWACLGKGAAGLDSLTTNRVLIAQLTTAGEFSFEINLVIGAPNGTSQKYVAKNPAYDEWERAYLQYQSKAKKRSKKIKKAKSKSE